MHQTCTYGSLRGREATRVPTATRRANAESAWLNKPEITPLSNSYHSRDESRVPPLIGLAPEHE
jgi:hypothetical protein